MRRRSFIRTASLTPAWWMAHGAVWPAFAGDSQNNPANTVENWPEHPFLQENFAPVQEEVTTLDLPIQGQLPTELRGIYLRNGPNPRFPPTGNYHWFDGDGMVHGVVLRDGKASYRNRFIRTYGLQKEWAAGRALWTGLNDPPNFNLIGQGEPPFKNTANTSLVWHAGRLLALWEGGEPYELALPDLQTIGAYDFGHKLRHAFTAHPKVDPQTGELIFFGYNVMQPPHVQVSIADNQGVIRQTKPIPDVRPVMMHDFAITQNYILLLEFPYLFKLERAFRGGLPLAFEPESGARLGVIRRDQLTVQRWFEVEPGFVFHTLNAYELDNQIILWGCRSQAYPQAFAIGAGAKKWNKVKSESLQGYARFGLQDREIPRLHRWCLHLDTGHVEEAVQTDEFLEFPRLHEQFLGRQNRFGYFAQGGFTGFTKFDLHAGTSQYHQLPADQFGGEGIFVPKSLSTTDGPEDAGWLVSFVFDAKTQCSSLIFVDTQDFTGQPVARIPLPVRVPYGFHGLWIDERHLA